MNLAQAQAAAVREIVAEAAAAAPRGLTGFQAEVTSVLAGGAADGNALVGIKWRGKTFAAAYLAHYTPAVGHRVFVQLVGTDPVIQGRVVGTPNA